jgi:hypothetical protein
MTDEDVLLDMAIRFPEATRYEISCRLAERRRDAERQSAVPATIAPVEPITVPADLAVPDAPDSSLRVPMPAAHPESTHVAAIDPVDALIAALDAATDDAERAALLAAAPEATRRKLRVRLTYRRFIEEADRDIEIRRRKVAEFTAALEAATDDDARLEIVRSADPKFLAEWRWAATATPDIRRKRYIQAIGAS